MVEKTIKRPQVPSQFLTSKTRVKTISDALMAKYDQIYQHDAARRISQQDTHSGAVETVRIDDWPADRKQALIYLARPGGRLLEIGCGRGEVLAALAPHFEQVVGTELSQVRAQRARRDLTHLPNCRILTGTLEDLAEIAAPPFDCIVWADVVEHVVDVVGAMHVLAELSRPGTQLVTVTPNVAFLPQRLRLLTGQAPTTANVRNEGFEDNPGQTILFDLGHLHYFTFRQIEILYRIAGFAPERRLGVGKPFSRLRNAWPTVFSGLVCVSGTYQGKEP